MWLNVYEESLFYFRGNLWPSRLPVDKKQAFLNSLSKLKQKVIWKWDDESLKVDSSRFMVRKWLPQNSILAHPNVKLFVTHGGLLSCIESVYFGVPMVGTGIFGDQMTNMAKVNENGFGIRLDFHNVTESSLDWALTEVLNNPRYLTKVKHTSQIFKDQPLSPLETAKFWVEYVIRHKGAPNLKSVAPTLSTIVYYNIDAYCILFVAVMLVVLVPIFVLRKILCNSKNDKSIKSKKD